MTILLMKCGNIVQKYHKSLKCKGKYVVAGFGCVAIGMYYDMTYFYMLK